MLERKDCRYIFYASNIISFYNSLAIIKKYSLPGKHCVFYSPRNHIELEKIPAESTIIELKTITELNVKNYKGLNEFIKNLRVNSRILKQTVKNSKYIIFIPHLINFREQSLIFNKRCVGYCIVEEGIPAYIDILNPYNRIKRNFIEIFFNFFINGEKTPKMVNTMNHDSKKFIRAFGNFKESFPKIKNKKVLQKSFPKNNNDLNLLPENSHLFIIDHIKGLPCSEEIYFSCFQSVLKKIKKENSTKVYIKFHPNLKYSHEIKRRFLELCKSNDVYSHVLQEDFFIEGYLRYQPTINIYGLKSASLLYGLLFGAKVYCFSNIYEKHNINDEKIHLIKSCAKVNALSNNINFIEP